MSDSRFEQLSSGATNSSSGWLSSHIWESIKSIPSYEMHAISDIMHGKGTLGEYAAVGLPLLAIGAATDGIGLTAMTLSTETAAIDGLAVTSVNALGLGS